MKSVFRDISFDKVDYGADYAISTECQEVRSIWNIAQAV